ncbi:polymeric immunoglobulin receptor-like isoform X2 [Chiloscyllium punctatum]|uniref:polymeric immunoglobulin receptor-like isoform X2 n=1 Tax=Chiloscyllium punctatum TaxID=137246 RepID=UPI003B63CD11
MRSLYVCLSAVLLSVSVRGHTDSANGWSITIADGVRAEEGGSAVLPCSFTHPDTHLTLTGSILWYKGKSRALIFQCTDPGPDHSQGELCENVIQWDGGNRFRFVGNLSNKDASIMMEGLSREDAGSYRCRVELNINNFGSGKGTRLKVEDVQGDVSVVSGTEGDSVTLPCIFRSWDSHTLTTVTWMRKEPYQHIVTFPAQSQGTWTTGHGGNRYELIGNLWEGNASIRINQLSVRDNHTYLCLVEYRSKHNLLYLIQKETRLQVHADSANGWSMTIADRVRAEEGGSAVLPCSFTHPDTNLTLTGSILWYKGKSRALIFKCTYPGPDHSQGELCENVIQRDGGNRFRFVGNLSNKDASIMMEGLSREDADSYRCRVELNIDKFGSGKGTRLKVEAAQGNVSVVSGTEGDSVTLPCIFRSWGSHTLTTVTWMRKEPYQHIVTFTAQSQGNWTTGHGGNRYELIGNPEEGNASTRINQLSVRDNHTYLCLVEYRSKHNLLYLIQKETQLQVHVKTQPAQYVSVYSLVIPLLILLLLLIVIVIIFITFRKKGGGSQQMDPTTVLKRNDPGSSSIPGTDQAQQLTAPDQDSSILYAEIDSNRTGGKRFTNSLSEGHQDNSRLCAKIDSNRTGKWLHLGGFELLSRSEMR